ncbi:MAG: GTPase Era, partial [Culicoidibacterales bacterium]
MSKQAFHSGFISIVGRPNVGKSTFLNAVVGQKVAIMSDKPQTTRNKIQGVVTNEKAQYVFIDTPGIHKPQHELGKFMTDTALKSVSGVDVVVLMLNATETIGTGDRFIIEHLKNIHKPVILVVNKIDLLTKEELYKFIDLAKSEMDFAEIVPISAKKHKNLDVLLDVLYNYIEEGPKYYPDGQVTDHPERFIMAEIVREKVLWHTREEIPHSVAVTVEDITRDEEGRLEVMVAIIVERPSQKGIIIGKNGQMLKRIGTDARKDINRVLGTKVHLQTWVKVIKDWRNKQIHLSDFGYQK